MYRVEVVDRTINVIRQPRIVNVYAKVKRGLVGPQGPKGDTGDPATNLVQSVNGKQGIVVLDASDVGADPTGSAAQALVDANDYTDAGIAGIDTGVLSVQAGTNITVDNTDPANPIISSTGGGGGGGSVDSVNGQTGTVVINTDDIQDTTSNRYTNDSDVTRLANTSGTNTGDQDLSGYATTSSLSGYVPTSRTVNAKALSSNVTLNQDDVADGTTYKRYSQTEKTKLAGIATSATANDTDANLKNRANHTGTQTASTISDFSTAADARITAQKGNANGLAELDSNGLVPSSQLPSYVDDVLTYANVAAFPATGTTGKIYIAEDTNLTYRWTGSNYVEISASLALGETSSTAYRGDRGKTAYDHSQLTSGNPHNVTKSDVGLGNVDNTSNATERAAVATLTNKNLTSGTNTFPTFNQNTTGSAASLTTSRTIGTLTGDVTSAGSSFNGTANNTNATTLATVNSNTGAFGSASNVATFTVNGKGLTTAAANVAIQIAQSQVTNLTTDLGNKVSGSNNGTPAALTLWKGTAAQYAAIGTKDSNTLYAVTA